MQESSNMGRATSRVIDPNDPEGVTGMGMGSIGDDPSDWGWSSTNE
jgi:hypothetical protein